MKKKLTAIFLCVALIAVAAVGASLAYFTDTDKATNTFTVGNVKIDLIESTFHREGNDNAGDNIPDPTWIVPEKTMQYVTAGHTAFTDEEIQKNAEGYESYLAERGKNMVPGRNAVKCPYVINTGSIDAYIRIRVMVPSAANNDFVAVKDGGVITNQWCSTSMGSGEFMKDPEAKWDNAPFITLKGYTDPDTKVVYDVYTFVRNQPLKAGKMTEWNVWNFIGLDKTADSADIQKAVAAGAITALNDGTFTLNVLVEADAIQAEGFADAAAAFAAFGK